MWLVRSILLFLGVAAVLYFAISNLGETATVHLFTVTYEKVPLNLVLVFAAIFGAGFCFLVMIFREFSLRASLRRLRRENMRLDDELTALRNLPLAGLEPPEKARPRS